MSYPEKGAKYAGQDRAAQLCRADGGKVPLPRPRPDIEGAARQELGRRMRDTSTFQMPDNTRDVHMPYVAPHSDEKARMRQEATSGEQDI